MQATQEKTVTTHHIGNSGVGYMVNTLPNSTNVQKIVELQYRLTEQFGGTIWNTPPETLHITLMDWLAPLVDYGESKDKLFKQYFPQYDAVMTRILKDYEPINVHFDTIKVTPNAIIVVGRDAGSFQSIRERFREEGGLLPGTKQAPTIIHSTIARFQREQPIQPIVDFIGKQSLSFDYTVLYFRLVRESVTPMLAHELIKKYPLAQRRLQRR